MTDRELEIELGKALGMRVEKYRAVVMGCAITEKRLVFADGTSTGSRTEFGYGYGCNAQYVRERATPRFLTDALPLLIEQMNKRECGVKCVQDFAFQWEAAWYCGGWQAAGKAKHANMHRAICEAALAALKSEK